MGMLSFDTTCPHCYRENAVLIGRNECRRGDSDIYDVQFTCRSCNASGIAVVISYTGGGPLNTTSKGVDAIIPGSNTPFKLHDIYPRFETISAPNETPDRASVFYIEAKENIQRGNYDTAVMLCRKVLDIATRKLLGEESKDEKLVKRISMLRAREIITEQMKDWAHIVRIDSNGAVHSDEEFSREEAEEMIGFTEVFLIYSFTLPAMVKARQHNTED